MTDLRTLREAIDQLIELGNTGRDATPPAFADGAVAWSLLHEGGKQRWESIALGLSRNALDALIRGLIHYSRTGRSLGGSVSPVIWLFAAYAKRFPEYEPHLTQWIVANRMNPYEPFGSVIENDAPSMAEYLSRRLDRETRAQSNAAIEQVRQRDAAIRTGARATTRLVNAIRRGDVKAVEALLATGADSQAAYPGGSLVELAESHGRTAVADLLRARGVR